MKVKVVYLARLSEDIKKSEEYVDIKDGTKISGLYDFLGLGAYGYDIFAAQNAVHASFDSIIRDNDEIAFFPTITGG
ncbi:MAG: hypothetical protein CMD90_00260 [Gammaproteobacteria bacterium]|nr:hypothetical protein [Gammaproteobacteria bacterium]|tara:strand:- start:6456 stop:6686 length:231 start_codon:yes stop_codon:yes gene_type:complete